MFKEIITNNVKRNTISEGVINTKQYSAEYKGLSKDVLGVVAILKTLNATMKDIPPSAVSVVDDDDFYEYIDELMELYKKAESRMSDIKNGIIGLENA